MAENRGPKGAAEKPGLIRTQKFNLLKNCGLSTIFGDKGVDKFGHLKYIKWIICISFRTYPIQYQGAMS